MLRLTQSPTEPAFVQDPYAFYDRARESGDLFFWEDYGLVCATSHRAVSTLLRDRRLGREAPAEMAPDHPPHTRPFYDIEAHSMLELEPPRHTRLRGLVLRAFTSRRISALAPEIAVLCNQLIDDFPNGAFDLLDAYGRIIPVVIITRLLGVPEDRAGDLLGWSNAMVAMYQARRSRAIEDAAVDAALAFRGFIADTIAERRMQPGDDLLTHLIAAEEGGDRLSLDELVTTCILLLNAGHEATVHTIGNGVKLLLERDLRSVDAAVVEEILRFDPPLHMFTRWVYEDVELFDHVFRRGDQVSCLLAAANRDPAAYVDPASFQARRQGPANTAFGGGIHFCVGAPLARLELEIGLRSLFERRPRLRLAEPPRYADVYHFHGLERLMVEG
ncbi:cytochrome P450 [Rubellimicrobium rubrum]|uniref:Cytochrome P450 n=1 Tax=Rubellimicrobium rubrum TaxID=2585369 RepID=A0A5C4N392_9RHOB|nr:cytochrome P450 [Rubellimicrobium rubrum]TNC50760.1 cytochrome P450 [Rubellimicrobium rubrum]